ARQIPATALHTLPAAPGSQARSPPRYDAPAKHPVSAQEAYIWAQLNLQPLLFGKFLKFLANSYAPAGALDKMRDERCCFCRIEIKQHSLDRTDCRWRERERAIPQSNQREGTDG